MKIKIWSHKKTKKHTQTHFINIFVFIQLTNFHTHNKDNFKKFELYLLSKYLN